MDLLDSTLNSKSFKKYLNSKGVLSYLHFAGLESLATPTRPDVAFFLQESQGNKAVLGKGIEIDASGMVNFNGSSEGRSELYRGKFVMDLTISMWLEDIGKIGFVPKHVRDEVNAKLGDNWWESHVGKRVTSSMVKANGIKDQERGLGGRKHKTRIQTWVTKIKEFPSKMRVKLHYFLWELKKK